MSLFDLKFLSKNTPICSAVILAAGSSTRFGEDKLSTLLNGIPVLAYALSVFESSDYIHEIVVVTESEKIVPVAELCDHYHFNKVSKVVCGGATRLESALSGASETDPSAKLIAIHDGARPLVTRQLIDEAIEAALRYQAAIPAIPARDTVKLLSGGFVSETPEREKVVNAQTPQVFVPELIKGALTNALQKGLNVSDDAQAAELLGFPVYITQGSEENIKITTPQDLMLAECILAARRERCAT